MEEVYETLEVEVIDFDGRILTEDDTMLNDTYSC